MTDDASPENLRKFLESDDPALRRMGLSMAKGAGVPEELLGPILGLYLWDDSNEMRSMARSIIFKSASDNLQRAVKEIWKGSYRTIKTQRGLQPKVDVMLTRFKDTPFDSVDVWAPALLRSKGDKVAIVSALGTFGVDAMEPLVRVVQTFKGTDFVENYSAYMAAVKVLGETGDARAVESLINVFNDEDVGAYEYAAEALGNIGNEHAIGALIDMLRGEQYIRCVATRALGISGNVRAVKPLIKLLEDGDSPMTRVLPDSMTLWSDAAEALGKIGDKRAVEPLIKALAAESATHQSSPLLQNAKEALRKLGHEVE